MPISLTKRSGTSKEKKAHSNHTSMVSASDSVPETSLNSSHNASKKEKAEDDAMKSITGRSSSHHPKLDPDSSSLGPIDTAKEAKEKNRSWVKTIGIRTLRLRKEHKNKSSAQGIFSSGNGGAGGQSTEEAVIASVVEPRGSAENTGNDNPQPSHKHVKKSSSGASKTSNGTALREIHSSSSTTTIPGADSLNKTNATDDSASDKQDPARFAGDGMSFKAKLIGILEVSGPRGDRICQEALSELKMAVKAAGEHKQKITLHVALDGLRIRDEKTGDCLYHHQVHKISFIAQDLTDARAFGYIFGSPDMGHRFFGIKTEKSASQVVIAMRDLFQVVFDLKKKEIERAKQQLEMQQKFLATRAAETAPKVEHKTSSIAETYIEGACALGSNSEVSACSVRTNVPEVDLLNLEVELNSLQEGLDNIHNNFADHAPFRGSTASISSDPMNPKFSTSSQGGGSVSGGTGIPASSGINAFGSDPFGDSFDPFDGGSAAGASNTGANSSFGPPSSSGAVASNHQQSPLSFGGVDPFAQIDPFPQPKFSNLENSDSYFNADPFDTPMGKFSFTFPNEGNASSGFSVQDSSVSASGGERGFSRNTSGHSQVNQQSTSGLAQRSSSAMGESIISESTLQWRASFDDNFVPDGTGVLPSLNGPSKPSVDIFTELDPLGTGRVRPFVDRKDFFQDLKNPPRKQLKDLYSAEFLGDPESPGQLLSTPPPSTSPKGSTKVQSSESKISIPNSFSTNFNPVGFDSAFKSTLHASTMSKGRKSGNASQQPQHSVLPTGLRDSFRFRSESPPNYSPPPPPPSQNHAATSNHSEATTTTNNNNIAAFSNNEYFSTPISTSHGSHRTTLKSTPPLLPPPGSSSASPGMPRTKKSPQLLKQMTISAGSVITSSSSPKTLPRSARLGKQSTVDLPSADEMSPIPNLTPPPRPPHGTLNKNVTLATAVPRPYSSDKTQNFRGSSALSFTARTFTTNSNLAPEPPPRPLQTTVTTTTSNPPSPQIPLVSPPPLPPKKTSIGPTLSNPPSLSTSKNLYTGADMKKSSVESKLPENDLPLPLPSRKIQSNVLSSNSNGSSFGNISPNRYCIPGSRDSRYEVPEVIQATPESTRARDRGTDNKVKTLSMEQALQQVASLSLMQLAAKLELPVEKLSNFTIQQLAEKLTSMELSGGDARKKPEHHRSTSNFPPSSNFGFESNFEPDDFTIANDISTASAPGGLTQHAKNTFSSSSGNQNNYDKYAVFRELTVEDASGFSVGAENDQSDDERSRTQDKTLTGRDSSSERTLQVEDGFFPPSEAGTVALNTMDDVTDGNLSDENDKFPLDEEVSKCDWASFDTNFDEFATTIAAPSSTSTVTNVIKLESLKKPESPWDSDENDDTQRDDFSLSDITGNPLSSHSVGPNAPVGITSVQPAFVEDKFLDCVLPPDPEEFNFQPFEKPAPIIAGPATGRRSSSSRDRSQTFEAFELEPRQGQFKRQSSGSSKHSVGKNSDYSDSGRHRASEYRSRNNSRDLDSWDARRDHVDEWEQPPPPPREGRDKSYDLRRDRLHRSDSRGSYSRQSERKYPTRDSDEEFVPSSRFSGNSRDGSLRRSRPSRGSSARSVSKREAQRSKENLDNDEEEDEVDDDDRSYASYHSGYSQSSHRRHRRHPKPPPHHPYPGRRRRHDYSPEKYSNHESDFDDSYEEENTRKSEYPKERYPNPKPSHGKGRPSSGGSVGSGKRYEHSRYDHESTTSTREYYKSRAGDRDREGRAGRYRRNYRRPPPEDPLRPEEIPRDYSDYSCEENSNRRKYKKSSNKSHDRERPYYYTNSPSWDSESQSPDRGDGNSNSGGDRRKIRWGSNYRERPRQSPSPLTISRQPTGGERQSSSAGYGKGRRSEYRFEDDFATKNTSSIPNAIGVPGPIQVLETFDSFQTSNERLHGFKDTERKEVPRPGSGAMPTGTEDCKSLTPQSPFEDNFVIQLAQTGGDDRFDSIEFKRGEDVDHFGLVGSGADVFFPAKFDVDLEVEKETKRLSGPTIGSCSSISITPISTVSSSVEILHRSSPSSLMSAGKRLESIRSEEERLESSEDGTDVGVIAEEDEAEEAEAVVVVEESSEQKDNELVLEKSGWMSFDTD